jgi:hypothetical protein
LTCYVLLSIIEYQGWGASRVWQYPIDRIEVDDDGYRNIFAGSRFMGERESS